MTTIVVVDGDGVQQTIPVLPNTGQATKANSLPVTLASDETLPGFATPPTVNLGTIAGSATAANQDLINAKLDTLISASIPTGNNVIGQVKSAYVAATSYTAGNAINAVGYGLVIVSCLTAGSVAWSLQWSLDGVTWPASGSNVTGLDLNNSTQTTFGTTANSAIFITGNRYFRLIGGTGGTFQYALQG
jgi:hypothetical protein